MHYHDWHSMPYDRFIAERRQLMAQVMRRGYETLT